MKHNKTRSLFIVSFISTHLVASQGTGVWQNSAQQLQDAGKPLVQSQRYKNMLAATNANTKEAEELADFSKDFFNKTPEQQRAFLTKVTTANLSNARYSENLLDKLAAQETEAIKALDETAKVCFDEAEKAIKKLEAEYEAKIKTLQSTHTTSKKAKHRRINSQ